MTDAGFSDEGNYVDELLAKMYGKRVTEEETLDLGQAKEEAKNLSGMEDDIGRWIDTQQPGNTDIAPGVKLYKAIVGARSGSSILQISGKRVFQGLGKGEVILYATNSKSSMATKHARLNTRYILTIGVHTDDSTRDHAEATDSTEKNHLGTRYFFDNQGNFGKEVYVPKAALNPGQITFSTMYFDGKPSTYQNLVWEKRNMTAGDFELAGTTLQKLQLLIKPPTDSGESPS